MTSPTYEGTEATVVSTVTPVVAQALEERAAEGGARRAIASRLVWGYLGLISLTILIPVLLYSVAPAPKDPTLTGIKEVSTTITAAVGSVTGVLGFVLGYYFKSEEKDAASV